MKINMNGNRQSMKPLGVENNWGIGIVGNTWPLHGRVSGSSPLSSTKYIICEYRIKVLPEISNLMMRVQVLLLAPN